MSECREYVLSRGAAAIRYRYECVPTWDASSQTLQVREFAQWRAEDINESGPSGRLKACRCDDGFGILFNSVQNVIIVARG